MISELNQQFIADNLKRYLFRISQPQDRRAALEVLTRFEAAPWYPQAMDEALAETGQLFDYVEGKINYTGEGSASFAVRMLLQRYLELIETGILRPAPDLFDTEAAVEYITQEIQKRGRAITPRGVLWHIRDTRRLRGQMIGHSLAFTRADLDAFVESYMQPEARRGRKKKETPEP